MSLLAGVPLAVLLFASSGARQPVHLVHASCVCRYFPSEQAVKLDGQIQQLETRLRVRGLPGTQRAPRVAAMLGLPAPRGLNKCPPPHANLCTRPRAVPYVVLHSQDKQAESASLQKQLELSKVGKEDSVSGGCPGRRRQRIIGCSASL